MNILEIAKKRYMYALKSYADYLCSELYARNEKLPYDYSFILSKKFYKFRDTETNDAPSFLEMKDVLDIILWAKYSQPPTIYFMICIQATTGCRIGGLTTLTRDRIDLDQRKLILHEKSSDRGSIVKHYVIAKNLLEPFTQFLKYIPVDQQRIFNISEQKYNSRLKRWRNYMHSHLFRDALYSIWEDMHIEEAIRDIMQNRQVKNIGARHYLKKFRNWIKRVERYDEIYPFYDVGF
jgi:integrase